MDKDPFQGRRSSAPRVRSGVVRTLAVACVALFLFQAWTAFGERNWASTMVELGCAGFMSVVVRRPWIFMGSVLGDPRAGLAPGELLMLEISAGVFFLGAALKLVG